MYRPTIGLEVHAELKTRTKMFCRCANDPDEARPNVNVCPVCLAHPGTLPVANKEAIRHILRMGVAVGGELVDQTEFDRKSYFYPDIPKGYQISQYEKPFVRGGMLAGVAITRVHLEEDTARSNHEGGKSLVDFNRAGIPLMELVTEPVIHDAETAGRFARELQLLLRTLGAGEANLEKGEMRIEANISVSKEEGVFGTKVEVKNINSFRAVERAIEYEVKRQSDLLDRGEKVVQSTRGWDEGKQETFHQRIKEGSADYRYFPEPDLPKLAVSEIAEFSREALRATLPELPRERRERYANLGMRPSDIEIVISSVQRTTFFDAVLQEVENKKEYAVLATNFFVSDLAGEPGHLSAPAFAQLLKMFASAELSSRGAKDVLVILAREGGSPEVIAKERGLLQIHDPAILMRAVETVLAQEEKAVAEYRAGKQASLQYLLGKAMKESKGAGNPEELKKILTERLA